MADILLICVREENKDDFTIELIRGLMSRGLTVSYAGAFYCERRDQYVYDSVTNLLFFASTYFREAQMKFTNFTSREGFLDNITFEQIDAKLVIYVSTRKIDLKNIRDKFNDYLKSWLKGLIVELIRNAYEMDFAEFESHYPDVVEVLGIDSLSLNRRLDSEISDGAISGITSHSLEKFIAKCKKIRKERSEKVQEKFADLENEMTERKRLLQELDNLQKKVEKEYLGDPSRGKDLVDIFFGSEIIDRACNNPQRAMFFDISRRIPKSKILCLHYEEKDTGEEGANLYFYPEKIFEEEEKFEGKGPEEVKKLKGGWPKQMSSDKLPPISPVLLPLKKPRELYSRENVRKIIDKHVLLALHPPLISVSFPQNDFMLEVDPEEPEIGFMSKKVNLSNCQTLEENLKIDTELREKLHIYRWKEERKEEKEKEEKDSKVKKFTEIKIGDRKESQEEEILILSRTENLYRVLLSSSKCGRYYRPLCTILKLAVLIFLIILAWRILQPPVGARQVFPTTVVALSGAVFIFWALKIFVLNYLLEPMYDILKWISYFLLLVILCFSRESLDVLVAFFLFTIPVIGIVSFNPYIHSAILYSLNDLFEIMGYNDRLKTEGLPTMNEKGILEVLRCGRFQTIVRDNDDVKVFFNSYLFPKIKYIRKKIRTVPRKIAYSSGILLSSEDEEKPETDKKKQLKEELIYRKPRTWRLWRTVKSLIFGKGKIEYTRNLDDKSSPNNRFIYFGDWNYVMKNIGAAIPVFPESVLFRNMIILAVLSGLIFNIFPENEVHLTNFVDWIGNMGSWHFFLYMIIPFIWVLVATELRIQFWRLSLILVFYYLLLFQPFSIQFSIIIMTLSVLFAVLVLFRFTFSIKQIYYSFRIWWNEKWKGDIVSIRSKNRRNERGTRIRRNLIVTRLFMSGEDCVEEERIYFNERFFKDIVEKDDEWDKFRENQERLTIQ